MSRSMLSRRRIVFLSLVVGLAYGQDSNGIGESRELFTFVPERDGFVCRGDPFSRLNPPEHPSPWAKSKNYGVCDAWAISDVWLYECDYIACFSVVGPPGTYPKLANLVLHAVAGHATIPGTLHAHSVFPYTGEPPVIWTEGDECGEDATAGELSYDNSPEYIGHGKYPTQMATTTFPQDIRIDVMDLLPEGRCSSFDICFRVRITPSVAWITVTDGDTTDDPPILPKLEVTFCNPQKRDDCTEVCEPDPEGACCFPVGECLVTTEAHCVTFAGVYHDDGTECELVECLPFAIPTVSEWGLLGLTLLLLTAGTVVFRGRSPDSCQVLLEGNRVDVR